MMQKLARTWRKSREDVDGDDYSIPTRDDSRPIDTQGRHLGELLFAYYLLNFDCLMEKKN